VELPAGDHLGTTRLHGGEQAARRPLTRTASAPQLACGDTYSYVLGVMWASALFIMQLLPRPEVRLSTMASRPESPFASPPPQTTARWEIAPTPTYGSQTNTPCGRTTTVASHHFCDCERHHAQVMDGEPTVDRVNADTLVRNSSPNTSAAFLSAQRRADN
jgi:hypothetical protein